MELIIQREKKKDSANSGEGEEKNKGRKSEKRVGKD